MGATREDLGESKIRLHVEIDPETFGKGLESAYRVQRKEYELPGFRKGKVPRRMLEDRYGKELFHAKAVELLADAAVAQAIEDEQIESVGIVNDSLQIEKSDEQNGARFSVDLFVYPTIELGDYKGLKAAMRTHEITDEDVDNEVEHIRSQNVRWVPKEGAAEKGDTVTIDYVGSIDGVPFEGGSANDHRLELGSERFIDGFEDQLAGAMPGDDVKVEVTFPDDYRATELAGKPAQFDVHVSGVDRKELPELDDDFAQDVSPFDTMEDFRAKLKQDMQRTFDATAESEVDLALIDQIAAQAKMDLPAPMVLQEVDAVVAEQRQTMAKYGIDFDAYVKAMGMNGEQLMTTFLPDAVARLRRNLVIRQLVLDMGLDPDKEENAEQLRARAQELLQTSSEDMDKLPPEQISSILSQTAVNIMLDRLRDMADIEKISNEEAMARQAAAEAKRVAEQAQKADGDGQETEDAPAGEQPAGRGEAPADDSRPQDMPYAPSNE